MRLNNILVRYMLLIRFTSLQNEREGVQPDLIESTSFHHPQILLHCSALTGMAEEVVPSSLLTFDGTDDAMSAALTNQHAQLRCR